MHCNKRKVFATTALALIMSFVCFNNVIAQEAIPLANTTSKTANKPVADEIPDEISLFGDESVDILTPPAKGNNENPAAIPAPKANINQEMPAKPSLDTAAKPALAAEVKPEAKEVPSIAIPAPIAAADNNEDEKPVEIAAPQQESTPVFSQLGSQIIEDIDDDVFAKMSDLEKETAVLNLELRKEKVRNDIEALKAMRDKAKDEEEARKNAEKLKQIALEKEEERKVLLEKQKLKNLEIVYEKERQEKILKAYKNKMLEDSQKWINAKAESYKRITELEKDRRALINDFKGKFIQLTQMADEITNEVIRVRDNYAKTISDLQTQISILNARLEASEKTNPFAEGGEEQAAEIKEEIVRLSDMYAIMEIRGKGKNLSAKLINDAGVPFMVKVGTALQSGHIIDEITPTYVRADKEGGKDYLYFSAGGVLEQEPVVNEEIKVKVSSQDDAAPVQSSVISSQGIPNLATEMMVR